MGFGSRLGESPNTWKHFGPAGADPGTILSALVAQLVDRLGSDGFWEGDYGWGVRVRRPFGARGMSSVRYRTRLGDLKNKQSTHTPGNRDDRCTVTVTARRYLQVSFPRPGPLISLSEIVDY